jgi:hypothetical protein
LAELELMECVGLDLKWSARFSGLRGECQSVKRGLLLSSACGAVWQDKGVFHEVDVGHLTRDQDDLGDVEAEAEPWVSQLAEPILSATLDEALFLCVHGIGGPAKGRAGAGFDLDKGECLTVPGYDVHLASVEATIVSKKHAATELAEVFGGEDFAEFTDLGAAEIFAEDLERQAAIQSNAMHQQASQARMMLQTEKAAAED